MSERLERHRHSGLCANGADCHYAQIIDNDLLQRLREDREAAMGMLRLLISNSDYQVGCKSNGGLACYDCRTFEWLQDHATLPGDLEEPSTETAAASGTTRRTPQKETTDVR